MDDLQRAHDAGASVARIATHCTEADMSMQHFGLAREPGHGDRRLPDDGAHAPRPRSSPGRPGSWSTRAPSASTASTPRARWCSTRPRRASRRWCARSASRRRWASTGTRTCRWASPTRCSPYQNGARQIDGALCALGAGAGNSPTEVLAATFDRLGHRHRRGRRRRARRGRGRGQAVPAALALDGPQRDRAGLGGGVLVVPAARGARRAALRRARATRSSQRVGRAGLRRRPGGHDHRRRASSWRAKAEATGDEKPGPDDAEAWPGREG